MAEQAIKSGVWVMSMNVFDRLLQMLLMVVLAVLLDPADFGLFGIALLGLSTIKRVSNLGLKDALIHEHEEDVDAFLNTAMTLRIFRGVIIAVVLFVLAPFIGAFLDEPQSVDIIRVIAFSPLLIGFHNPGVVYFQKNLDFHKEFLYSVSGSLTKVVVGLVLAITFRNVWALVLSYLAADLGRLITSYVAHDYRPRPSLNRDRAREMISYGKWITGSSIVYFLYSEGDDIVVATLLTPAALGFYQLAYRLSNAPGTEVTEMIGDVAFPAFSQLQDDMDRLREAFFQTLRLTTLISFPMAVGIAAVAPVFVRGFLGEQWVPMIPVMQILAGYGLLLSITATYGSVWRAVGRPDYGTKTGAIRVVLMFLFIVPVTTRWGITGTAALVVGLFAFPLFEIETYLLVKSLETTFFRVLRELVYPAVASAVMGAAVVYADSQMALDPLAAEFALLIALGGVIYAIGVAILELQFGWGIERQVRIVSDALF